MFNPASVSISATPDADSPYAFTATMRTHQVLADEPVENDGADSGPTPIELLLASMATCTAITVRMYLKRQDDWQFDDIHVTAERTGDTAIAMEINIIGDLNTEQLLQIERVAGKCPVVKMVSQNTDVTKTVAVHTHNA